MANDDTKKYSLDELESLTAGGDYTPTRHDAPTVEPDEEFWRNAHVVMPPPGKASVHLRVDADVLDWFKAQGRGHLTRMNAVLRSYMDAHKHDSREGGQAPTIRMRHFPAQRAGMRNKGDKR